MHCFRYVLYELYIQIIYYPWRLYCTRASSVYGEQFVTYTHFVLTWLPDAPLSLHESNSIEKIFWKQHKEIFFLLNLQFVQRVLRNTCHSLRIERIIFYSWVRFCCFEPGYRIVCILYCMATLTFLPCMHFFVCYVHLASRWNTYGHGMVKSTENVLKTTHAYIPF